MKERIKKANEVLKKLLANQELSQSDLEAVSIIVSLIHNKLYDTDRKIFVIEAPPIAKEVPKPSIPVLSDNSEKMTLKRYILEKLVNNPMDIEDIAKGYKKDGYSKETVTSLTQSISSTISTLRKAGHPIVKIKKGRYAIRKQ